MSFHTMSQLSQRLTISFAISALILLAIYYAAIPVFSPLFALGTALIISYALYEFYRLVQHKGYRPLERTGMVVSTLYTLCLYLALQDPRLHLLPASVLLLALMFLFIFYFRRGTDPIVNISTTILGIVYLTIPLSCIILIVYGFPGQDGRWWLLYLLLVAKMTDTGAYFIGRKRGKTPFFSHISPSKTWEGALGGLAFGILFSVGLCLLTQYYFTVSPLSIANSVWLGALISILAQFGDLAESRLKRDAQVKDSNRMPGLGGMLDIVDSLVFAAPVLYMYLLTF